MIGNIRTGNTIAVLILLFLAACATVVPPSGGPRDTTPPVAEEFKPDNYSQNFKTNKVVIKFDEFIELKKLSQQLVVSPAMPEKPEIKVQGKKLLIHLPDSLSENTTYTIFLGNAIVNYKEGIPVANFEYVFSTGNEVDSLMIEGYLVNAFDHKPMEAAFVMLYKETDDSVPYHKRPYYLTKVDKNGYFLLNNIHHGKYKLFALNDLNSNYLFDQPTEEIAFVDSLVAPYIDPYVIQAMQRNDSTFKDSTYQPPKPLHMFMFTEAPKEQMLLSYKLLNPKKFRLIFALGVQDLQLRALDLKKDTSWHFDWLSPNRDTVITWLTGVNQDTIHIEVAEGGQVLDTLRFVLHKPKRQQEENWFGKKKKEKEIPKPKPKKKPKLAFTSNARGGFPFFSDIVIKFKTPVVRWEPSKIKILHQRDSLIDTLDCKPYFADTAYQMHLVIPTKFKEYERYGLFVPDSVFFDIFGATNDTIKQMFVTTEMRQYGSLKLTIDYKGKENLIIQLLNSKEQVIFSQKLPKDGVINYPYLNPGNYYVKAIADRNGNGKWDTGNYMKKIQPERTYFLKKTLNIRANWDVEHTWIIE